MIGLPPQNFVYPLGDSILDNVIWMMEPGLSLKEAKEQSVEGQLEEVLNPPGKPKRYKLISHAYDGFTTNSLLDEDIVGRVLQNNSNYFDYLEAKMGEKEPKVVRPLDELQEDIESAEYLVPHYVVLSVGGNDFRENLLNPWNLIKDIGHIQSRYLKIVERIKGFGTEFNVCPILVFLYRTDVNNDAYGVYETLGWIGKIAAAVHAICIAALGLSIAALLAGVIGPIAALIISGLALLLFAAAHRIIPFNVTINIVRGEEKAGIAVIGALMKKFYAPILDQAQKDHIPILDLANTFNPFNGDLYISGIEPSQKGGALIAEGIAHIIENHDFKDEGMIYTQWSAEAGYTRRNNIGGSAWEVFYPPQ